MLQLAAFGITGFLLGAALAIIAARVLRQDKPLAGEYELLSDILGAIRALQEEQGNAARQVRNLGEAMVILSEQTAMDLGAIKQLVKPPTRRPPAKKPAAG